MKYILIILILFSTVVAADTNRLYINAILTDENLRNLIYNEIMNDDAEYIYEKHISSYDIAATTGTPEYYGLIICVRYDTSNTKFQARVDRLIWFKNNTQTTKVVSIEIETRICDHDRLAGTGYKTPQNVVKVWEKK